MYVGVQHTVKETASVELPFACNACGFQSPVRIRTEGFGAGVAHFGVGNQTAHDAARRRAVVNVRRSAKIMWEALACPRCGARSKNGDRTRLVWIVVPVAMASAFLTSLIASAVVLQVFADTIGSAGIFLVAATLVSLVCVMPSVMLVIARSLPIAKLRRNAAKHAEFL